MERITISLDERLAREFDAWMVDHGYSNRSEAVRDLVREKLGSQLLGDGRARWCAATISYVYDRSEPTVTAKVIQWQHDHHDLVVSTQSAPLDHKNCLETVVARGEAASLQACAAQLIATRGVRHGSIHLLPLKPTAPHAHAEIGVERHGHAHSHRHLQPLS